MSLKELKEQFVSDLSGGSVSEIYALSGIALASVFSHTLVSNWLLPRFPVLQTQPIPFLIDFYYAVIVQLQSLTIFSSNLRLLYIHTFVGGVILFIVRAVLPKKKDSIKRVTNLSQKSEKSINNKDTIGFINFITVFRSQMMIITNLAILAVDFHSFPRRFAKVETWGTSLMDLGVGLFVFSMGLANSRSVIKKSLSNSSKNKSYIALICTNTFKALPVLLLGVVRLVSVKFLEYQEHVTEYGVHWNFFMTLGILPIFMGLLDPILEKMPRFLVALGIGACYEFILQNWGVSDFILDESNRNNNMLTMNKEGAFSFLGYLSIFIFGQSFGSFVLTKRKTPNNLLGINFSRRPYLFLTVTPTQGLTYMSIISWTLFSFCRDSVHVGSVSRRLANLAYILMTLSFNSVFLLGCSIMEKVLGPLHLQIYDSINRNGLAVFLIANVCTGFVNTTVNTLEAGPRLTNGILLVYGLFWVLIAKVLDHYKIYIRI